MNRIFQNPAYRGKRLFHLDVPSCAGDTVVAAIQSTLVPGRTSTLDVEALDRAVRQTKPFDSQRDFEANVFLERQTHLLYLLNRNFAFISGQMPFSPLIMGNFEGRIDSVILLREPLARFISQVIYMVFAGPRTGMNDYRSGRIDPASEVERLVYSDVASWMASSASLLLGVLDLKGKVDFDGRVDRAENALEQFRLVGFTHRLEKFGAKFGELFGVPLDLDANDRFKSAGVDGALAARAQSAFSGPLLQLAKELVGADEEVFAKACRLYPQLSAMAPDVVRGYSVSSDHEPASGEGSNRSAEMGKRVAVVTRSEMDSPASFRSPVIVLGMHRSGTSYLASVIGALGAEIGTKYLVPGQDNPHGYFEDEEFVAFHSSLLERLLGPTLVNHALGRIYVRDWPNPELTPEEIAAGNEIARVRSGREFWGWKDPRTCLFLRHWLSVFPHATLVAVYRHPLEVYGSIIRRKSFEVVLDETLPIDTWTTYNREILAAFAVHAGPKLLISTGAAFRDPKRLAAMLCQRVGLQEISKNVGLPEFASKDFHSWPISKDAHALFVSLFPEAAVVFDRLQELAVEPLEFFPDPNPALNDLAQAISGSRPEIALPLLADTISPGFLLDRKRFQAEAAQYISWRIEAADGLAANVAAEWPIALRRIEILEEGAAELTEWRASFLADESLSANSRPVYLWAANSLADAVSAKLANRGTAVAGIIDAQTTGKLRPEQFAELLKSSVVRPFVVVCSRNARDAIIETLETMGFQPGSDFVALPEYTNETTNYN